MAERRLAASPTARWRPAELVVDPRPFERAAEILFRALRAEIDAKGRVRLAIPGGSALRSAALARRRLGDAWRRVALTWVDERCVPLADPESNRGAAARTGLLDATADTSMAEGPIQVLPLYADGERPESAITRVAAALREEFANTLDVVLLGMGADGHVASLFPDATPPASRDMVVHVRDSPKPPSDRISLTHSALATARVVVLVAAGESKRAVVERLVAGDEGLPAHGLPGLVVVTDLAPRRSEGEGHG